MKQKDKDHSIDILQIIERLTEAEVSSVTIHSPNPDFASPDDHAISYTWMDMNPGSLSSDECKEEMFYGPSIYDALVECLKSTRNPETHNPHYPYSHR